jgi:membrane protein required for colicin V production
MNWLDYFFIVVLAVTMVVGIVKGLIRQVIGLIAAVLGLVLAALYYEGMSGVFQHLVHDRLVSNFLGFVVIFFAVVAAGAVLGHIVSKVMKGPLAFFDRFFGGVFGLVKALLICGVIVFALAAFSIARPAVETSKLAPVCVTVTRAAVHLIPQDVKDRFTRSYDEIRKSGGKRGEKI